MTDADQTPSARSGAGGPFWLIAFLALYLVGTAVTAGWGLVSIFPGPRSSAAEATAGAVASMGPAAGVVEKGAGRGDLHFNDFQLANFTVLTINHADQGFILLAIFAGVLGSFMHSAQSLGAFVGNRQFHASWTLWYLLRPGIGASLGLLFYMITRAGLISANADSVNPYGVVAFGGLAGWFSKRATDKLAEVFETLFRTAKDAEYKDKLDSRKPKLVDIDPKKIVLANSGVGDLVIKVTGQNFLDGARVAIDDVVLTTNRRSDGLLEGTLLRSAVPQAAKRVKVTVVNPANPGSANGGHGESSEAVELVFE